MLQEMMVYVGQMESYAKGVEVLQKLAGVDVCQAQLYRVTNTYGSLVEPEMTQKEALPVLGVVEEDEMVHAEMDGGMILTDDEWREVKVGRLFRENDCRTSTPRSREGSIRRSLYSAYLGGYEELMSRFDSVIVPYGHLEERLVFIAPHGSRTG
ncbi:MAG TPA: hypothetical protein PK971_14980 [Saprospiraceae bacterium]|nr:hypothetical protein [Saprospiraceae bacterium]